MFHFFTSNISLFPIVTFYFEGGAPMTVGPENYLVLRGYFVSLKPSNIY
jgi:hypothetical protein